jgi:hypothetical protein
MRGRDTGDGGLMTRLELACRLIVEQSSIPKSSTRNVQIPLTCDPECVEGLGESCTEFVVRNFRPVV